MLDALIRWEVSSGVDDIEQTTSLLTKAAGGDRLAAEELFPLIYGQLRELAGFYLKRERKDHTLQPTALVHEAYLRLVNQSKVDWRGKSHFFAMGAEMIRRILVDHARAKNAKKRGGGARRITLDDALAITQAKSGVDIVALDRTLTELSALSARQGQVVQLRFFGGLGVVETAAVLGVSERTVKGDWRVARAWLRTRLSRS